MSKLRFQSGFTLLEMMVAMALSALVSLIGAMALAAGADFYARSGLRQHSHDSLRAVERTMRLEWESRGSEVILRKDSIEFVTVTPVSASTATAIARVRYHCQRDAGDRFTLMGHVLPSVGTDQQEEAAGEAMLAALTVCEFSALQNRTDDKGRVTSVWVPSWSGRDAPPRLMRAKLLGQHGDIPAMVFVARGS